MKSNHFPSQNETNPQIQMGLKETPMEDVKGSTCNTQAQAIRRTSDVKREAEK
jgi:hypothetical protein